MIFIILPIVYFIVCYVKRRDLRWNRAGCAALWVLIIFEILGILLVWGAYRDDMPKEKMIEIFCTSIIHLPGMTVILTAIISLIVIAIAKCTDKSKAVNWNNREKNKADLESKSAFCDRISKLLKQCKAMSVSNSVGKEFLCSICNKPHDDGRRYIVIHENDKTYYACLKEIEYNPQVLLKDIDYCEACRAFYIIGSTHKCPASNKCFKTNSEQQ